jgi:hypothetical protein
MPFLLYCWSLFINAIYAIPFTRKDLDNNSQFVKEELILYLIDIQITMGYDIIIILCFNELQSILKINKKI